MLRRSALGFCLALLAALPARAGLDDIVRLDVLDGGRTEKGTYLGAIRLTLAEGWKTYWRKPGEAGIPPQFEWRGARNVGELSFTWPSPRLFEVSGFRSVGYSRELVLPVEITPADPGRPVRLKGRMSIGVCSDICIPADLPFDRTLDAQAAPDPAIAAALAQRPYTRAEAGVRGATCRVSPVSGGGLRVEARIAMPPAGGEEYTMIETGDPALWASSAETRREGGTLIASAEIASGSGAPFALDRSELRFTVVGSGRAVDILGCTSG